ncbi:MAG: hypothetical protein FVQ80_11590 [Planctomycetes bacterium]|nr:hypothetical protein [Planctomycetota bacterium]
MAKKKKATLSSRLKALNKAWKTATPKQGGVGVPDGTYEVRIDSAILEEAKSTSRLQIHWTLAVLTEEYANKMLHKYDGCDKAEDLDWVQGTLETLELEIPDNIADIGPTLEEAQGLLAEVTVQTRDEFTNIYFNDLLADQEEEGEEEEGEEEEGEEEEEEVELEVDDRVSAEIDGEDYEGAITAINTKKGTADVDFDDETSGTHALDELTKLDDEEEGEEEEEGKEEEGEEEESEEYDEDDVKAMNLKELADLIEEEDLKIKTKGVKAPALRKAVIKKLF